MDTTTWDEIMGKEALAQEDMLGVSIREVESEDIVEQSAREAYIESALYDPTNGINREPFEENWDKGLIAPETKDYYRKMALAMLSVVNKEMTSTSQYAEDIEHSGFHAENETGYPLCSYEHDHFISQIEANALRAAAGHFAMKVGLEEFREETHSMSTPIKDVQEAWEQQVFYLDWLRNRAEQIECEES